MSTSEPTRGVAIARASAATSAAGLPTDLVQQAAKRLSVVSLIYAVTYSAAFYTPDIVARLGGDVPALPGRVEHVAAALSVIASFVIFALARSVSMPPAAVLDFGLLYQVVASFGIAIAEFWRVSFDGHLGMMEAGLKPWFGISWVCVWILTFPMIVPSTPGKTLLASLTSASMAPLALLLSLGLGATTDVPGFFWAGMATAMYGSALIAYVTSRFIYGLGRGIREAREMGSYNLVEELGRGGMGEVWRAEHRMLARPAAIKLIRRESLAAAGGADARRRFEREAKSTSLLQSPHTIQLYDFGTTNDGRFYYVMELLDGVDVESFVKRFGAVAPERVVAWMLQACDSLGEAHERGMVHRDIKPANLFVCRFGRTVDFVKVLDFGLVKDTVGGADATKLTAEGIAAGTPGYMAPEMAGGIGAVDHRADLYAMGCVAFWALTGSLVFEADNPVKMIVDHVKTDPPPPSARVDTAIPAELDRVVLDCLAKRVEDRPQTADELAARLRATGLAGAWTEQRAQEWWSLHLPPQGS